MNRTGRRWRVFVTLCVPVAISIGRWIGAAEDFELLRLSISESIDVVFLLVVACNAPRNFLGTVLGTSVVPLRIYLGAVPFLKALT